MKLTDLADAAQVVIALGTLGGFVSAWVSARRAREAATDSRRSAELTQGIVDAERERIDVELKPVIDLDCYQTDRGPWIVAITNRGPRDVEELSARLDERDAITMFAGAIRRVDSVGLGGENNDVRIANMAHGAYNPEVGSATHTIERLYRQQAQYVRIGRASRSGGDASVTLDYVSGGRNWHDACRIIAVPSVEAVSEEQLAADIYASRDGTPLVLDVDE